MAISVAFGAIGALAGHLLRLHRFDPLVFHAVVALAMALGIPVTRLAHRAEVRARDDETSFLRPILLTAVGGALVGVAAQTYTAFALAPWESLWFLGVSLGKQRTTWFLLAAGGGALFSVAGGVLLVVGLRALRRSPSVLDADERLGVPGLAATTLAAACLLFVLSPRELGAGAFVLTLGLAFLGWMWVRDSTRLAFVRRVFAGEEPDVEIVWQPSVAEKGDLPPVADLFGDVVLAEKVHGESYRSTARGRGLMLLAETLEETSAPIVQRLRLASVCGAAALFAALCRTALVFVVGL